MNAYTAVARAGYLAYLRDKTSMIFTFAFPLVFLAVFGLIFHGQRVNGGAAYISYIAPGVLSWGIGNAAVFGVAFTLMHWRRDDLLRLIWRTPTPLTAVLGARWVVALATAAVQAVLFTAVAVLAFGLEIGGSWAYALPVLLFGSTAFAAIGLVVGALANTPEAVAALANCVMVPMAFLSGAFYPIDLMPGWLQSLSRVLPLRYFDEGITKAFGDGGTLAGFALDCGALAGFALLFAALAAKTFRWSNRT
ncbi:ABC-2 type transport system permease protein [Kitasatospora sp. MMS16-BH015]|uniref:ABC transporter permease n=1 Tax=Kitasatospora sp. MMS16-BH015 TaxID=2018025 RepID=UPI000CA0F3F8|nr:ABC transporter permease [Kitasatospora sp. MMS16-BH015]AUG80482.1 ABC-2 type transport system permease protein [Kitasatospora sp. MMS16-BH015]